MLNVIHDVASEHPFRFLFANFMKKTRFFPKGAVVAYTELILFVLLFPVKGTASSAKGALKIANAPSAAKVNATNKRDSSSNKSLSRGEKQSLKTKLTNTSDS